MLIYLLALNESLISSIMSKLYFIIIPAIDHEAINLFNFLGTSVLHDYLYLQSKSSMLFTQLNTVQHNNYHCPVETRSPYARSTGK